MKLEFKKFSRRKKSNRLGAITVLAAFLLNSVIGPGTPAFAQGALLLPGTMVKLTPGFAPVLIKGLRVYPENPLRFDFIVDPGDSGLQGEEFVAEAKKAMKYFLSSLTVPEKDLWVNLSPFEKDRIIPDKFGKTEMGRDMLGQDYILKQLSASLTYPETELGKKYWDTVGNGRNRSLQDLSKVWIVPNKAVVYSKNNIAYVLESHLKVMMEEDYENKSLVPGSSSLENVSQAPGPKHQAPSLDIFRTLILPQIEKEVNEGENFVQLRQLYNSLILATWFKRNLKQSILSKVYVGQNKIDGVTFSDGTDKNKIYEGYLEAFKKGVYNIIKEDEDAATGETIPRKYFSGGIMATNLTTSGILTETGTAAASQVSEIQRSAAAAQLFAVQLDDPKAVSSAATSLPASNGRAPQFNLFRSRWNAGPLQYLQTGHFEINADSRRLVMPAPDIGMVRQVRSLIRQMSENKDIQGAFENMRPVLTLLLSQMSGQGLTIQDRAILTERQKKIMAMRSGPGIQQIEKEVEAAKVKADSLRTRFKERYEKKYIDLKNKQKREELTANERIDLEVYAGFGDKFYRSENEYSEMQDKLINLRIRLNGHLQHIRLQLIRSEFIETAPAILAGKIDSTNPDSLKRVLQMSAILADALTEPEWIKILRAAQRNFEDEIVRFSEISPISPELNGLQVQFVANTPDVFTLNSATNGKRLLNVNLLVFLNVPTEAQILMHRYDILNIFSLDARADFIKGTRRKVQNTFADANPYLVAEIFRMLAFLRMLDTYNKSSPMMDSRERILQGLEADKQYTPAAELGRTVSQVGFYQGNKNPDNYARIERILAYIYTQPILMGAISNSGFPNHSDRQEMANIFADYTQRSKAWFQPPQRASQGSPTTSKKPAETSNQPKGDTVKPGAPTEEGYTDFEILVSRPNVGMPGINTEHQIVPPNEDRIINRIVRRLSGALAGLSAWAIRHMSRPAPAESPNLGAEITNLTPSDARAQHLPAVVTTQPGQTVGDIAQAAGQGQVSEALAIIAVHPGITPDSDLGGQKIVTPGTNRVKITVEDNERTVVQLLPRLFGNIRTDNIKRLKVDGKVLTVTTRLTPGQQIDVQFTDEQLARWNELNSPQPAAAASSGTDINQVGGINLDPSGLVISETGEKFKFDVPIDPKVLQKLQQNPVNGFVPVILNIVPIGNLPQFLGISKAANTQSPA